jgi:hypothetical protein
MRNRLTAVILLLYPRRVRKAHGPEIVSLMDDLIAHEGRSRTGLFIRLAIDGLVQRIASTATVWTIAAVLAATSVGGLAASGFAAANAPQAAPRTVHAVAPAGHTHRVNSGGAHTRAVHRSRDARCLGSVRRGCDHRRHGPAPQLR